MADTSPADGAADRPVPQYILGQANPDCPMCVTVLTRSQKRYREKMEAIREKERLEQHMNQVEFSFQNHRLQAERRIKQLEQRLENAISLEDHNMKVTEKCDEYQAMLQQMTADTERAYANEKETLLVQLVNKKNELDSDKKHKDLLVKKITELQTELNNCKKEKSKDEQAKSHRQEEVITKLQAAIKTRDEEIAWLKAQMKQREEEHRQAISPRKDLINRQQTTTPSSQHRAAPNKILYRSTNQASPSAAAPSQPTPPRGNNASTSRAPSAHTPQLAPQLSRDIIGGPLSNTRSPNGILSARSNSISTLDQVRPATTMPALNGKRRRNVLTTPSKNAPSVMGPLTTQQMQGNPVGGDLTPNAGVTAEQVRAMCSTTPAPNTQIGSPAGGTPSAPPSKLTQLSASQQELFKRWFSSKVIASARSRQASGNAFDYDFALLGDDVAVRHQAVQKVYNISVQKGFDVKAQFLKEVQQSQARQQQQKAQVETQTGALSTMQMNAQPGAAPTIPQNGNTQDGNLFNWLPSVAEPTKQPSLPPPRRSPRLQASQLANTSGILPNAGQMRNPMQHPPALYSQEAMRALSNINALRQAPTMNNSFTPNGFAPLRPQKPMPNNAWNSPAAATNLFQANIPTFPLPQPGQNGGLQQHNGAFQQNNGGFQQNNGGYPQNNGRFQQNNGGFQQNNGAFQQNNRAFQQNNGAFQQNNGGYQFIDDDLEITGSKRKSGVADDDNEPPKKKKAGPNGPASQP